MTRDDDTRFEPRLGRSRDRSDARVRRPATFLKQVKHAVARAGGNPRPIGQMRSGTLKTGRFNARGRGVKLVASFPRENGWTLTERGMRFRARRVVVKARVVKMRGSGSKAAYAHLRYLQRDGVTVDGERGRLYSSFEDEADGSKFLDRGQDDRHQFRLIVAPEDGPELGDLHASTRRLMAQMERDLQTQLDWVAVDHHNTGHPHSHIVIRGVTDDGKILNIAGDYIAHGIRHRASEIVTLELGMQSEWEVQKKLGREVEQDRFTRLDRAVLEEVNEQGLVDLRVGEAQSYLGRANRYLLIERLEKLERMDLAREEEPARWSVSDRMEKTLREMGERGDIIKTMHRALSDQGIAHTGGDYAIHRDRLERGPIIGRLVGKGLAGDQLGDRMHLIIDGVDARAHYVEIANGAQADEARIGSVIEVGPPKTELRPADHNIVAFTDENDRLYRPSQHLATLQDNHLVQDGNEAGYIEAHVRRLEALRRAGIVERLDADHWRIPEDYAQRAQHYDAQRSRQVAVRVLSIIDLEAQTTANAATWLDRDLIADAPAATRNGGFGREVRDALARRRQWLIEQGLARSEGNKTIYQRSVLSTLARRELQQAGENLARERGLSFFTSASGERITGTYRESVQLVSGKYALVEKSREFALVPWRPVIEKELGRTVSGLVSADGISWEFGRRRGPSIGM
jgi:type IV secretory pathway VirD2 relaxase